MSPPRSVEEIAESIEEIAKEIRGKLTGLREATRHYRREARDSTSEMPRIVQVPARNANAELDGFALIARAILILLVAMILWKVW